MPTKRKTVAPPELPPVPGFDYVELSPGAPPDGPPAPGSLDDLVNQAEVIDNPPAPIDGEGAPGEPEKPKVPNSVLLTGLFTSVRESVCLIAKLESPRTTFTDAKAEALGVVWGNVCDQFGIDLAAHGGRYTVVAMAVLASVQVLGPPIAAARLEMAAKEPARLAEPEAAPGAPPPPSGPRAFTPGVIHPTWSVK